MSKRFVTEKEDYISVVTGSYAPDDSQRDIQVGETRDELVTLTVTEDAEEHITWMHLNFIKKNIVKR
jgi:hypothetical protein